MGQTLQVNVALSAPHGNVWRRLRVSASMSLFELHFVVQTAMGWHNTHQHHFQQGSQRFTPDMETDADTPEDDVTLGELLTTAGNSLAYVYGVDEVWTHDITLESVDDVVDDAPRCLGGEGVPPSDDEDIDEVEKSRALDWDTVNDDLAALHAMAQRNDIGVDYDDPLHYNADIAPEPAIWREADESLRIAAIEEHHVQDRPHALPKKLRLHAAMHCVVENQLALDAPPEAKRALQRLVDAGMTRHEAVHALANVSSEHMASVLSTNEPFNNVAYAQDLEHLNAAGQATR